jgi:P27 family predicted phage terminase small subunit
MNPKQPNKPKKCVRPLAPPPHLSPTGAQEWARLAPAATAAGTLTPATAQAFEMLVGIMGAEREATAIVATEGIVVRSAAGTSKPHPAIRSVEVARTHSFTAFVKVLGCRLHGWQWPR